MTSTCDLQHDLAMMLADKGYFAEGFFDEIINEYIDSLLKNNDELPTNCRWERDIFGQLMLEYNLVSAEEKEK